MSIRHTAAGLAVLVLAGCGSAASPASTPASAATGGVSVVASTNVYGSIAQAVGGDRVAVTSLVTDPAADPHSYESTPRDAAMVSAATLVIFNGGGYDDWMPQLLQSAGGDRAVIDVGELSGLTSPDGEFNEHFWYSLPTVQKLATAIAADLATADPAHAAEFTANAGSFGTRVGELAATAQAIGAAHPGARVAVTEPVPGYLIETAGLTDATPPEFSEAIEEDTDPPAAVLQETLALFGPAPVQALIVNAQTETPTTDQVRQAAQTDGVPIVEVTETLPAGSTDYLSWMGGQVDALATAMNRG
jgi:zinc/manganese transport system substrate-binding protein